MSELKRGVYRHVQDHSLVQFSTFVHTPDGKRKALFRTADMEGRQLPVEKFRALYQFVEPLRFDAATDSPLGWCSDGARTYPKYCANAGCRKSFSTDRRPHLLPVLCRECSAKKLSEDSEGSEIVRGRNPKR